MVLCERLKLTLLLEEMQCLILQTDGSWAGEESAWMACENEERPDGSQLWNSGSDGKDHIPDTFVPVKAREASTTNKHTDLFLFVLRCYLLKVCHHLTELRFLFLGTLQAHRIKVFHQLFRQIEINLESWLKKIPWTSWWCLPEWYAHAHPVLINTEKTDGLRFCFAWGLFTGEKEQAGISLTWKPRLMQNTLGCQGRCKKVTHGLLVQPGQFNFLSIVTQVWWAKIILVFQPFENLFLLWIYSLICLMLFRSSIKLFTKPPWNAQNRAIIIFQCFQDSPFHLGKTD